MDKITPSPFYIEEIQDTLEHLKIGGIENLANAWVNCNKRPQVNHCYFVLVIAHTGPWRIYFVSYEHTHTLLV